MLSKIPSVLNISERDLEQSYRHKVALVKGGNILTSATSSLAGGRYLQANFGRSCHAEVNAFKNISSDILRNPRKVAKDCLI